MSNCLYCCGLRLIARDNNDNNNILRNIDDTHRNDIKFAVMTNQPQYVMRFFRKYPQFFQNYCFCLHSKVEPMTSSDPIDGFKNSTTLNGANNNNNTTPIIPIAIDTNMYVAFCSLFFFSRSRHTRSLARSFFSNTIIIEFNNFHIYFFLSALFSLMCRFSHKIIVHCTYYILLIDETKDERITYAGGARWKNFIFIFFCLCFRSVSRSLILSKCSFN